MYIERLFAPHWGWIDALFLCPKFMGKSERLEVWFLSKIVYSPDKPNDCRYCHFWKNNKTGCCLGEDKCYYLISVPQKPKLECDGCPYGRDHPCIGWCTKKILKELGVRWYVWACPLPKAQRLSILWVSSTSLEVSFLLFRPLSVWIKRHDIPQLPSGKRKFPAERCGENEWRMITSTVSNQNCSHSIEFRRCYSPTRDFGTSLPMPRCCTVYCLIAWVYLPGMDG